MWVYSSQTDFIADSKPGWAGCWRSCLHIVKRQAVWEWNPRDVVCFSMDTCRPHLYIIITQSTFLTLREHQHYESCKSYLVCCQAKPITSISTRCHFNRECWTKPGVAGLIEEGRANNAPQSIISVTKRTGWGRLAGRRGTVQQQL